MFEGKEEGEITEGHPLNEEEIDWDTDTDDDDVNLGDKASELSPEHASSPPSKEHIKEASPKNEPIPIPFPEGADIDLGDKSDIFVNMGGLMDDFTLEGLST